MTEPIQSVQAMESVRELRQFDERPYMQRLGLSIILLALAATLGLIGVARTQIKAIQTFRKAETAERRSMLNQSEITEIQREIRESWRVLSIPRGFRPKTLKELQTIRKRQALILWELRRLRRGRRR